MPSFSADNSDASLPTFHQWKKANPDKESGMVPVQKILWNDDWKSYTAFCEDFRYSWKFKTQDEYLKAFNAMKKILLKPSICHVVWKEKESSFVFDKASDASETYQQYEEKDWGFILKQQGK